MPTFAERLAEKGLYTPRPVQEAAAPENKQSFAERLAEKGLYAPQLAEAAAPPEKRGFFGQLADVAMSGGTSLEAGLRVSGDVATGAFDQNTAGVIAEELTRARPAPAQLVEAREDIGVAARGITEAEGFGETALAVAKTGGAIATEAITNPKGLAFFTAEQAANMAPALAGMFAGGKVGGAIGLATPVPGGAAVGSFVGALAGSFLGELPVEAGMEFIGRVGTKLNEMGIEPTEESVKAFLENPELVDPIIGEARRKAVGTAAVDAPLNLLGGRIASSPGRAALKQATKTAVRGASEATIAASAKTILKQTPKLKRAGFGAAGVGFEAASEGISEATGQLAATGEVDPEEVAFEIFGGLGGSVATLPVSIASQRKSKFSPIKMSRNRKAAPAAIEEINALDDTFTAARTATGQVEMTVVFGEGDQAVTKTVKLDPKNAVALAKNLAGEKITKEAKANLEKAKAEAEAESVAATDALKDPDLDPQVRTNLEVAVEQANTTIDALSESGEIALLEDRIASAQDELPTRDGKQKSEIDAQIAVDQARIDELKEEGTTSRDTGEIPLTEQERSEAVAGEINFLEEEVAVLEKDLRAGTGSAASITPRLRKAREDLAALKESDTPQASPEIQALNKGVNASVTNPDLTFTATQAPVPEDMVDFVSEAEKKFGKKVVFFTQAEGDYILEGAIFRNDPDTIYINAAVDKSAIKIFAHELIHALRVDNPKLYNELLAQAKIFLNQGKFSQYQANLAKSLAQEGQGKTADEIIDEADEELVADTTADMFVDPEFLLELSRENPTLFQKLITAIKDLLDKIGQDPQVEGLRTAMADVLRTYAETRETAVVPVQGIAEQASAKTPRPPASQELLDAIEAEGNLGFDTKGAVLSAILESKGWARDFEVTGDLEELGNEWRAATLAADASGFVGEEAVPLLIATQYTGSNNAKVSFDSTHRSPNKDELENYLNDNDSDLTVHVIKFGRGLISATTGTSDFSIEFSKNGKAIARDSTEAKEIFKDKFGSLRSKQPSALEAALPLEERFGTVVRAGAGRLAGDTQGSLFSRESDQRFAIALEIAKANKEAQNAEQVQSVELPEAAAQAVAQDDQAGSQELSFQTHPAFDHGELGDRARWLGSLANSALEAGFTIEEVKADISAEINSRSKAQPDIIPEMKAVLGITPFEQLVAEYPQWVTANEGTIGGAAGVRFSRQDKLGFFSPLAKEMADTIFDQKTLTGAQLLKKLVKAKKTKAATVKKEELDSLGFEDYLRVNANNKLTLDQVTAFIENNGVQIEEVVKDSSSFDTTVEEEARETLFDNFDWDEWLSESKEEEKVKAWDNPDHPAWLSLSETREEYEATAEENDEDAYKDYYSVDFDNLDAEDLFTKEEMDGFRADIENDYLVDKIREIENERKSQQGENETKFSSETLPGGTNYREVLLTLPNKKQDAFDQGLITATERDSEIFTSAHFPDDPNILAHMRLNDREVNGEKVLFIEEIQSDWNIEGRKKGFVGDTEGWTAELDKQNTEFWNVRDASGEDVATVKVSENKTQVDAIAAAQTRSATEHLGGVVPPAPFVTSSAWQNLAMKRVLTLAANEGYDRVSWINGEQTAERYSLDKKVESIWSEDRGEGQYFIEVKLPSGRTENNISGLKAKSELEGLLGKEIAKRVTNREGEKSGDGFVLKGDDLKIEAQWARNLYDKAVPNFFNKFGKKYGEKVEGVGLNTGEEQQSLKITDEMVTGIQASGLARFSREVPTTKERREKSDKLSVNYLKANLKQMKAMVLGGKFLKGRGLQALPLILKTMPLFDKVEMFGQRLTGLKEISQRERKYSNIQNSLPAEAMGKIELIKKEINATKGDSSALLTTFMDLMNTASLNQVHPNDLKKTEAEWSQGQWDAADMRKVTGHDTPKKAWLEANKLYRQLGKKSLQNKYIEVITHMKTMRDRLHASILREIQLIQQDNPEGAKVLLDEYNKNRNNLKGAYSPLGRFGNWSTIVFDDTGNAAYMTQSDSFERATLAQEDLQKTYPGLTVSVVPQETKSATKSELSKHLINTITEIASNRFTPPVDATEEEVADLAKQQETFKEDMLTLWLQNLPDGSTRANNARRKGVKGFSRDALRSYAEYSNRAATSIANAEEGRKIGDLIKVEFSELRNRLKSGEDSESLAQDMIVMRDIRDHIMSSRSRKTQKWAQLLGKMTATWYLSSPSQFMLQISQVGIMTFPKIASRFGVKKAGTALTTALGKAMTPRSYNPAAIHSVDKFFGRMMATYTEEEYDEARAQAIKDTGRKDAYPIKPDGEVMIVGDQKLSPETQLELIDDILKETKGELPERVQAHVDGLISDEKRTEYLQSLLILRMAESQNLLDITLSHQAQEFVGGRDKTGLTQHAMFFIRESELISRKAAILAAVQVARDGGKDFLDAFNYADFVNIDTLYDYSTSGKAQFLRANDLLSSVLFFQTFRVATLWKLIRLMTQSVSFKPENFATLPAAEQQAFETKRAESRKEFIGILSVLAVMSGGMGLPAVKTILFLAGLATGDDDDPVVLEHELYQGISALTNKTTADLALYGAPSAVFGTYMSTRLGFGDIFEPSLLETPEWMEGAELSNWAAAQALGPAWGILTGVLKSSEHHAKGETFKAIEATMPKVFRDGMKAYRIAVDGAKNSRGRRILDEGVLGPHELILMAAGVMPFDLEEAMRGERTLAKIKTRLSKRESELLRGFSRAVENEDILARDEIIRQMGEYKKKNPQSTLSSSRISGVIRKSLLADQGYLSKRDLYLVREHGLETVFRPEPQR